MTERVRFTCNGVAIEAVVEPRMTAVELLRDRLGLTGTHLGCETGVCGACTVVLDGVPARACLILAIQLEGASLLTIEGLTEPGAPLHPVQQAFLDCHSFQCGFCAPGVVMTTVALLAEDPLPDEQRVREALADNLCRCTGYEAIVDGMLLAADRMEASNGGHDGD